MAHLRAQGLVHHDLKPGNVLLNDALAPFIRDFKLSRFTTTLTDKFLGSAQFVAPKDLEGAGTAIAATASPTWTRTQWSSLSPSQTRTIYHSITARRPMPSSNSLSASRPAQGTVAQRNARVPWTNIVTRPWYHGCEERPPFAVLIELMRRSDEWVVPGTNAQRLHVYKERILAADRK
jgi:serine/threonine protein kinase